MEWIWCVRITNCRYVLEVVFWLQFAQFRRWPLAQSFTSLPDLVARARDRATLARVSAEMSRLHSRVVEATLPAWAAAARLITDGPRGPSCWAFRV